MHDTLMSVYRRLPAPARSVAATLRGIYLQHWRSGPEFERVAEDTLTRDTWSPERLHSWREEQLARLLHRAATRVPYYRELWTARRRRGDRSSVERLEHWPILEKEELRANPKAFIAEDQDSRRLFHERTSGTTGKPIDLWLSRRTLTALYAIAQTRTLTWHDIPARVRMARLGGQLVVPVAQRQPPFWVWNAAMRQLYMSTFHLSPALIPHYLDALERYRIRYIGSYPSSVIALAHEALRLQRTDLRMLAVITNAEGVDLEQRRIIGAAFGCRVIETYGQAEIVGFASECPDGHLHQWPECGIIEVHGEHGPVAAGESGEFVCTSLLNPDQPLVRYRVGDRGRLAKDQFRCSCGRTLPVIEAVEGRTNDSLRTADGRTVFWLNPVFYGLPVRESQIEQESLTRTIVRVAPAAGFDRTRHGRIIAQRLRDRMGDVEVRLEFLDAIPRTANGKLRAVISRVASA